jgi:chromate transporter
MFSAMGAPIVPRPRKATFSIARRYHRAVREIVWFFLKMGWLAFGGPVAQIGLMHLECVERKRWIDEDEFVRALNFCHVLPGPEATQMAIYIGWKRAGYVAGALAGLMFILPGYLTLTTLGWVYLRYGESSVVNNVLWGFRPVGLALILAAMVRIGRAALKSVPQVLLALLAFVAFTFFQVGFVWVLAGCALLYSGWRWAAGLIVLVPRVAEAGRTADLSWFFLKAGLVSFGGAYALLPFLREGAVAHHHWIGDRQMIDALALGETTPGPLISIGIFIGYLAGGMSGATVAAVGLFLPSFVLVLLGARHIDAVSRREGVKQLLKGVTAGVVGLMLSVSLLLAKVALFRDGMIDWWTVALGLAAFAVLMWWKWRLNVVAVVIGGGLIGLVRALA